MSFTQDVKNEIGSSMPKEDHCLRAELFAFLMEEGNAVTDRSLLENDCCKRAFLRGAFLERGSFSDPFKSNDLEFTFSRKDAADLVREILESFEIRGKMVERNGRYVVYLKDGDLISEFLLQIGANKALLAFENARVVKDVKNSVNRRVNFETANLRKAANAGVLRAQDIEKIEKTIGLDVLPENLREAALLRKEYPDVTLQELGEMMDPPVGKSGVNHRLRKLHEIAEGLA